MGCFVTCVAQVINFPTVASCSLAVSAFGLFAIVKAYPQFHTAHTTLHSFQRCSPAIGSRCVLSWGRPVSERVSWCPALTWLFELRLSQTVHETPEDSCSSRHLATGVGATCDDRLPNYPGSRSASSSYGCEPSLPGACSRCILSGFDTFKDQCQDDRFGKGSKASPVTAKRLVPSVFWLSLFRACRRRLEMGMQGACPVRPCLRCVEQAQCCAMQITCGRPSFLVCICCEQQQSRVIP